ncbi:TIGR04141 family sporadically distributed protein (plasmid) [Streptomyces sp. BHT-5-2]|uniref:TIGR04141 family sporadically distributed protein n=1 Tax=Streptomyces sp. BHT-5-2 TaxID=2866715 RepID=UPI001C8EEC02|nr:TIGR04141 family sporadically distributed protein [Streptomyces sp. BHT-5-2]QZL08359.1 TIGR04141 family sporadically distributed protein [Streptomyces sp. BHT-5-2]
MATHTAVRTVYRLSTLSPTPEAMFEALDHEQLDRLGAELHHPDVLGVPAVYLTYGKEEAADTWCAPNARTTGIPVFEPVRRTGALLLLAVDGQVYAVTCGNGYRLVPDALKDKRFGLSFAIRMIDPRHISGAVTKALGRPRTDISLVAAGTSVPALGIRDQARVVRHLGGHLDDVPLTRSRHATGRAYSAQGGVGLRLPLGIEPADLVEDLRTITQVCQDDIPHPDLEFVDHIVPVTDAITRAALDASLDRNLGAPPDGRISFSVPLELHDTYAEATVYRTRIGTTEAYLSDDFDLAYVLTRARINRPGSRLAALRDGTVALHRGPSPRSSVPLATTRTLDWIQADLSLGSRTYCLLDGDWYELGAGYIDSVRDDLRRLFTDAAVYGLPHWPEAVNERAYNRAVAKVQPEWLFLDGEFINNPLKRTDRVEICDLLTPDGTLILVKQAGSSGSFSHLLGQAQVAVELLVNSPEARCQFVRRVAQDSGGRIRLPEDFTPRRLVLAVRHKSGATFTPDSLFAFSQITLHRTTQELTTRGVSIEVVPVPTAASIARTTAA